MLCILTQKLQKTLFIYKYHGRILEIGVSGSKVIGAFDSKAGVSDCVENLVIEDIVVVDKGTKEEVEDKIVTEIEIRFEITHVV